MCPFSVKEIQQKNHPWLATAPQTPYDVMLGRINRNRIKYSRKAKHKPKRSPTHETLETAV